MDCTVVGFGKLGRALALRLLHDGSLKQIVSSHLSETEEAKLFQTNYVEIVPDVANLKHLTNVTFLTVRDSNISSIAEKLKTKFSEQLCQKIVLHCSAIFSDEILGSLAVFGAKTASAHPLQTFYEYHSNVFKDIYWIVQTSYFDEIKLILEAIGGNAIKVDFTDNTRWIYHTSAVVASNFLNLLILFAKKLMAETKLEPKILLPIIEQTLNNNKDKFDDVNFTPLTGPLTRSDLNTLKRHRKSLAIHPDYAEIYCKLALSLSKVALLNNNITFEEFVQIEKIFSTQE